MQRKRQLLEVSLAISQIAKTLQENQGATEKLYEAQLKQEQQLEEANKVIQKKNDISEFKKNIESLENQLKTVDNENSELNKELKKVSDEF